MKKRYSKFGRLLLVAGLSLSMITGCNSSDEKESAGKEDSAKEEKVLTAEDIADNFVNADTKDITINGTDFKFIVEIEGKSGDDTMKIDSNIDMAVRTDPQVVRILANVAGSGMDSMDVEGYLFREEDGKIYFEMKKEDGTYQKASIDKDTSDLENFTEDLNKPLFSDEMKKNMYEQLKQSEYAGKQSFGEKKYDTLKLIISEEKINSLIEEKLPTVLESMGDSYKVDEESVTAYLSLLPKGYENVVLQMYFDDTGLLAGIALDLSNGIRILTEDDTAVAKISVFMEYNDTSEITVPDAEETSLGDIVR